MQGCPKRTSFARHALTVLGGCLVALCQTAEAQVANAQSAQAEPGKTVTVTGDRLGGFVLPIQPINSDIRVVAQQCWSWQVDDTTRIQLEGDVQIDVGGYAFTAAEAVVWINRLPSSEGLVNQLAVYFPRVEEPTRRAGLGVTGDDVLIVGSARGSIKLSTAIINRTPPEINTILRRGEKRLARYLRGLLAAPLPALSVRPQALEAPRPVLPTPVPGASPVLPDSEAEALARLPKEVELPPEQVASIAIFQPSGMVSFTANQIEIDESDDTIIADGRFLVDYDPMGSNDDFAPLQLSAGAGVIFLRKDTVAGMGAGERQISINDVEGIYLEEEVIATDGRYDVHARAVYYDIRNDRALMLDALLRTYNRFAADKPVFARAKEMRQLSADEWVAEKAKISTSSFMVPQLAIGLDRVTITRRPADTTALQSGGPGGQGERVTYIEGEDLTIEAGGIPFFYWPEFSGEADAIPFKSLRLGYDDEYGMEIETTWNLFALLGMEPPIDGMEADLLLDGFTKRGPGLGLEFKAEGTDYRGEFKAYGLYDTGGIDRTSAGVSVDIEESFRGEVEGSYSMAISNNLTLRAELAWMSDPTWSSAWRIEDFDSRLEYMSGISLDYRSNNTELTLSTNYSLMPFVSNNYQMASRPYYVDKAPELAYRRYADSLFSDAVSWTSEYSASLMRIKVTDGTPNELGVPNAAFATTNPDESIHDLYYGKAGYNSDFVTRFDTRQEMSLPLDYGATNVVPYVSARATGYLNQKFETYNPDAKNLRFFGSAGLKTNTTLIQSWNTVRNSTFDLDRLRQVIRPYAHAWVGVDSLNDGGLPVYDQEVEAISGGSAIRAGVRQIFQTKRGGGGRRRSVDWIDLDMGAQLNDGADVFTLADARTPWTYAQSPNPTWVDWRPELSQWGSHLYGNLNWNLSDTFSVGGSAKYLVDTLTGVKILSDGSQVLENYDGLMTGSVGFQIEHSPAVSTYLEYRYIQAGQTELLQAGIAYKLGRRYLIGCTPQYDLLANEMRAISGTVTRTFNDFDLQFEAGYDVIRDSPSVSLRFGLPAGGG